MRQDDSPQPSTSVSEDLDYLSVQTVNQAEMMRGSTKPDDIFQPDISVPGNLDHLSWHYYCETASKSMMREPMKPDDKSQLNISV